jgi:membrane protein involved in colicin uptake
MNNRIGKGSQMQILEKVKDFVKQTTIRQRITAGVVALLLIVGAVSVALSQTRQVSESVGKVSVRVKADKTSVERKSEAEKQAKLKAEAEAKAKAGSDAKAKEEADKKAQEQAQVVAQQQAQAEQQAQAQAVAQQQQQAQAEQAQAQAQAVAEQSQAQATKQAQAVAPPQQAPQQTPPAPQQPPQYIDWSQEGLNKAEYNASQGLDANGNVSQTVGGSPWGK